MWKKAFSSGRKKGHSAQPQDGKQRRSTQGKKRESIEQLLEQTGSRDVSIHRSQSGSYGFNLRGTAKIPGGERQRGQYVRSVDFGSTSHEAGLRSGDRIIEVNGEQCDDESHEEVIRQIKVAPSPLKLLVVRDPRMRVHAKKVTQALLGEEHTYVMNDSTNIPHFTVEMTEAPLGRTKMLQERLSCIRFEPPGVTREISENATVSD
eukprot:m.26981 g.26981  ORF g.26981 m.26981 type:complete len:206 (+) comp11864_c0_seq1:34-651(+)